MYWNWKKKLLQFISLWFLLDDCILPQKGEKGKRQHWVSPTNEQMQTNPKIRIMVKKKKKSYILMDKGKIPKLIWSMLLIVTQHWTMDHNYFFMLCFHVTVPLIKKE